MGKDFCATHIVNQKNMFFVILPLSSVMMLLIKGDGSVPGLLPTRVADAGNGT